LWYKEFIIAAAVMIPLVGLSPIYHGRIGRRTCWLEEVKI